MDEAIAGFLGVGLMILIKDCLQLPTTNGAESFTKTIRIHFIPCYDSFLQSLLS